MKRTWFLPSTRTPRDAKGAFLCVTTAPRQTPSPSQPSVQDPEKGSETPGVTSPCGCQRHTSWNPQGRHLLNGNAWHNSDVSVWELTGLLLAGRSKLCDVVYIYQYSTISMSIKIVHQAGRSSRGTATRGGQSLCRGPNQCSSTCQC